MNFARLLTQLRAVRDAHVGIAKTLEVMIAEVEREQRRVGEEWDAMRERDRDFWTKLKDASLAIGSLHE